MHIPRIALIASMALVAAACSGAASPTVSVPAVTVPPASVPAASSAAPSAPAASAPAASAPAASTATGDAVTIAGFAFSPGALTVKVGTSVTWTNQDSVAHTVTADDGSFDSGHLGNGLTFKQTFAKAGTFAYHCAIHRSMTASITVTP